MVKTRTKKQFRRECQNCGSKQVSAPPKRYSKKWDYDKYIAVPCNTCKRSTLDLGQWESI